MAQADSKNTTFLPWQLLSASFRDPFVAEAFRRAERDHGQAFAVPRDPPAVLSGGAAEPVRELADEVLA